MATEKFANNASSTLSSGISDTDLSLTVSSASSFPTSGQFRIKIENEILLVTSVASNVFTVSRGQEGTSAASHNSGSTVTHILTAGAIKYISPSSYTEPVYIADPTNWIDTGATLLDARRYSRFFIVGNTLYIYGGLNSSNNSTNTIWSAPISNPTNVTNTGSTLPYNSNAQVLRIGSYLYMFGVMDGSTSRILQASISDPTSWSNTGYTIPNNQIDFLPVIIDNNIYAYGGYISGTNTNKIITASTSNPTSWSDTGKTLPVALDLLCTIVANDKIYLISGWTSTNNSDGIYIGNITDPTTIFTYSKTFPIKDAGCSHFTISNSIYVVGGDNEGTATSAIYSSSMFPPYFMGVNPNGLPIGVASITGNGVIIDGYCYLYGGRTGGSGCINKIHRSKNRIQAMAQPETQPYLAQKAIFPNGEECEYSVHQKSGVLPWQVDTYAPRTSF
jgi:hypothetical protein